MVLEILRENMPNVKILTVETPPKGTAFLFDYEKDITAAERQELRKVLSRRRLTITGAKAARLLTLSSRQKESLGNKLNKNIESANDSFVSSDKIEGLILDRIIELQASAKILQAEQTAQVHPNIRTLIATERGVLSVPNRTLAFSLQDAYLFSEKGVKGALIGSISDMLIYTEEKESVFRFARVKPEDLSRLSEFDKESLIKLWANLRILFPEESINIPKGAREVFLDALSMAKEKSIDDYIDIAFAGMVVAAEKVNLSSNGLEITMPERPYQPQIVHAGNLPERRRF